MANGKTALVTGASRGIGKAIAERLAQDGFAVIVNYASNATLAEELVKKITAAGGRAKAAKADVSKVDDVKRLFDETEAAFGGIDVLVNNAGVLSMKPIAETDDAAFENQININLRGSFNTMREAVKRLREGGRIINLSTSLTGTRMPNYGVYVASKAGVEALTSILSKELRGRNITVNAVAPGPTATELFFEGKSQEFIDRITSMIPLGRLGTPEEIASAVAFLAGPDAGWINGQTLRANGGMV